MKSNLAPRAAASAPILLAGGLAIALGLAGWRLAGDLPPAQPHQAAGMLLAPMIGVIEPCILAETSASANTPPDLVHTCTGPQGSAAALVESTLTALQGTARGGPFTLGYTLPIPLLKLFRPDGDGWAIDRPMLQRLVRTLRDTQRPAIVYLFSTHFEAEAPIEAALASEPSNLAQTRDGALANSTYYGAKIFNWTFATTENSLTARRVEAVRAVIEEVCRLPPADRAKIRGVTLLGELHHLFPDFQAGMGYDGPYRITDYSGASVAGFRQFLAGRFETVERLNQAVQGDFKNFSDVDPPSRDIRTEPLTRYAQHIDAFAHGSLPVAGWAYIAPAGNETASVQIYRDGHLAGTAAVDQGRQDVLAAKPQFGTTNTGWRFDLDFTQLVPGLHRIDVFLKRGAGKPIHLGTREIAIMDRRQQTPTLAPQARLPESQPADAALEANIDFPVPQSSYYYNPLVPLWHAFRAQQVRDYLRYFDQVLRDSCLADTPRYTHQIIPFTNPSWDENKFAIQASLRDVAPLRLGISLYGEPTYGASFPRWYASTARHGYGITEFHPLKAMTADDTRQMLSRHAARGAEFLSFFLEPRWQGQLVPRGHNLFSFDPDNRQFGSDVLYRSMQQVLTKPRFAPETAPQSNTSATANATP